MRQAVGWTLSEEEDEDSDDPYEDTSGPGLPSEHYSTDSETSTDSGSEAPPFFSTQGRSRRMGWLEFEDIYAEEREFLAHRFRFRATERSNGAHHVNGTRSRADSGGDRESGAQSGQNGSCSQPFSLAFSGGGLRAASFQAGVLWRLAEAGRLKDVEYFAVVSGGSYIGAAFTSHLVEAGRPPQLLPDGGCLPADVDKWYLGIVARTLSRMQDNMPYLARDLCKSPCALPKDGSSCLPRIFDIPMLVVVTIFNFIITSTLYIVLIVTPLIEVINTFFGGAMRRVFCTRSQGNIWEHVLKEIFLVEVGIKVKQVVITCGVVVFFAFVLFVLGRKAPGKKDKKKGRNRLYCWLSMRSGLFVTVRTVELIVMIIIVVTTATLCQLWEHKLLFVQGKVSRLCFCHDYVENDKVAWDCTDPWRNSPDDWVEALRNMTGCHEEMDTSPRQRPWEQCGGTGWKGADECIEGWACKAQNDWYSQCEPDWGDTNGNPSAAVRAIGAEAFRNPLKHVALFMPLALVLSVILIPFFPGLYTNVLSIFGPLVAFLLVSVALQQRVFGPITPDTFAGMRIYEASHVIWVFVMAMLIIPVMHILKSTMHRFYRRSLRRAFFCRGLDKTWVELGQNPYCPFLLITATVSDFLRPGDKNPLNDISFSALHTGGAKTGYTYTNSTKSVARCVALSGAAIDAFILGKKDAIKYRFWMEFLSLSMGDFMIFEPTAPNSLFTDSNANSSTISIFGSRSTLQSLGAAQKDQRATWFRSDLLHLMHRVPSVLLQEIIYGLMLMGALLHEHGDCGSAHGAWIAAAAVASISCLLSFFAFFPGFDCLLHSVVARSIHQLFKFYHRAPRPPSLVHVTDGGLLDNTGVLQLMRRQSKRMLLIYGGNDPKEQFKYLKKLVDSVAAERLGGLFDPQDPRRDLRETFHNFVEDREAPYMRLSIKYGWGEKARLEPACVGELFIVMSRLSPAAAQRKIRPLLTEEEIIGSEAGSSANDSMELDEESLPGPLQRQLGGCCCDCCHFHGCNCGRKFPNPPNSNQCLTPQLFNSLCRLGRDISGAAVEAVSAKSPAIGTPGQSEASSSATSSGRPLLHPPPPVATMQRGQSGDRHGS